MNPFKKTVSLSLLIVILIALAMMSFETTGSLQAANGEHLYKQNCMRCHGADGTKGLLGAKNLQKSVLADSAIAQRIKTGKGFMPAFKKKFSTQELTDIVGYIKNLRKN
ncbi:MAG: c-type cytochrome [Bacteroidota bacterium]